MLETQEMVNIYSLMTVLCNLIHLCSKKKNHSSYKDNLEKIKFIQGKKRFEFIKIRCCSLAKAVVKTKNNFNFLLGAIPNEIG